ncbi:MAG: hypothetical protein ACOYOA_05810 [Saprospiraceae bacterium]
MAGRFPVEFIQRALTNEVYAAVKSAARYDPAYQATFDELRVYYKKAKAKKAIPPSGNLLKNI